MSFSSAHDAKEQVRQSVDIVDLVGSYIPLSRQGNRFVGICPWHDDARPSLQVNPDRQSWKCWVCDIGGDIFSFVMQREGVDFREALTMLADRAGVSITSSEVGPKLRPGDPRDKRTLYAVCQWAAEQFQQALTKAPEADLARKYFADRGFNQDCCSHFHVGFSPNNWNWLLDRARTTPYSPEVLEAAGLVGTGNTGRKYDRFKGRVIFPIRDTLSRTIGFGGRVMPEFAKENSAKYINSPETRLFSKSEHLYGLDLARDPISQAKNVVVVEGYTDVMMAHQFGLKNVVAVLGTALGPRHIRLLRRYADSITLVLDGDEAGQRRTNEVLELFVAGEMDLRILTLPTGLDPCDFLLEHGADAMRTLMGEAVDAFEHAIRVHTTGVDLVRDTHRANQALERLLAVVAKAPRLTAGSTSAKFVRERQVLARLARDFRVDESTLRARLGELRRSAPGPRTPQPAEQPHQRLSINDLDPHESELLQILIVDPSLLDMAVDDVSSNDLTTQPAKAIYAVFEKFAAQGETAEFEKVLGEIEHPQLKKLFVELDEQASVKEAHTDEDVAVRLRLIMDGLRFRQTEPERRDRLAALEQQQFDEKEELSVLEKILEDERKRQGISAPTDG